MDMETVADLFVRFIPSPAPSILLIHSTLLTSSVHMDIFFGKWLFKSTCSKHQTTIFRAIPLHHNIPSNTNAYVDE